MCIATHAPAVLLLLGMLPMLLASIDSGFDPTAYYTGQSALFLSMNGWLSGWPVFWQNVTELGDAAILLPLLTLVVRCPRHWAAICSAIPLTVLYCVLGKRLFDVPRPAAVLSHEQFTIIGDALTAHNSLPSGHTLSAFAIMAVVVGMAISARRGVGRGLLIAGAGFALAVTVGASRVAVGAHWPLDVVAGAGLGIAGGASGIILVQRLPSWWRWAELPCARVAFALLMSIWGGMLVLGSLDPDRAGLMLPWLAAACAIGASVRILYGHSAASSNGAAAVVIPTAAVSFVPDS